MEELVKIFKVKNFEIEEIVVRSADIEDDKVKIPTDTKDGLEIIEYNLVDGEIGGVAEKLIYDESIVNIHSLNPETINSDSSAITHLQLINSDLRVEIEGYKSRISEYDSKLQTVVDNHITTFVNLKMLNSELLSYMSSKFRIFGILRMAFFMIIKWTRIVSVTEILEGTPIKGSPFDLVVVDCDCVNFPNFKFITSKMNGHDMVENIRKNVFDYYKLEGKLESQSIIESDDGTITDIIFRPDKIRSIDCKLYGVQKFDNDSTEL